MIAFGGGASGRWLGLNDFIRVGSLLMGLG